MDDLEVTTTQLESAIVLHAIGAVDSDTAPRLQEPLLRAVDHSSGTVRLDAGFTSFVDVIA